MSIKKHEAAGQLVNQTLIPILRPALPKLIIGTLASVLAGLSMLAALWSLIQLLGDLSAKWAIWACVLWLIGGVLASGSSFLCHSAEASFTTRLRRKIAARLTRMPSETLARYGDDKLRRLVADDISALHHVVAHLPGEVTTFFVVPVASIVLLVTVAGPAALLALIPGVLTAFYYLFLMPKLSARHGKKRAQTMSEIVTAVDDYSRGIRINRIFGAQAGALASYRAAAQKFTSGMVQWVGSVATPAATAIALLQAVSTYAIAYSVSYQQDAIALGAALLYSLAVVTPAMKLGHGLDYVSSGKEAANRIAAFLQESVIPSGNKFLPSEPQSFEAIGLKIFVGKRQLLNALTFQFLPGTITAITGYSGTGKSSLLRTLAGYSVIDEGVVALGNINIYELSEESRGRWIHFIPQRIDLLASSVRENLELAAPAATDEHLLRALKKAQIEIALETETKNLSGGELQRIGLARAFLTTATVILLDEPTSALDAKAVSGLMQELQTLAKAEGKIIIVVTHDMGLVDLVDGHLNLSEMIHGRDLK